MSVDSRIILSTKGPGFWAGAIPQYENMPLGAF
jgi:hypothetical protein